MHLREQLYIATIADCGSITGAAEKLHISQPALSTFLGHLEDLLEVQLFHRYAGELVPTFSGELYLEAARKMLYLKSEFDEMLSDLKKDHRGRLRIGMQIRRSPTIIPMLYREFGRTYPKVEMSFAEGVIELLEEMLNRNELDLVLCNKIHETKGLDYTCIGHETLLLALSGTHPLAQSGVRVEGRPHRWIDLRLFDGEVFILQRLRQSQRNFSDALLQSMKVRPGRVIEVQNIEASTRMAALGMGVSFVLDTYAKNFHFLPKPAYFLVGDDPKAPPSIEFVAVHKKGRYIPAFMEAAIEIIGRHL